MTILRLQYSTAQYCDAALYHTVQHTALFHIAALRARTSKRSGERVLHSEHFISRAVTTICYVLTVY